MSKATLRTCRLGGLVSRLTCWLVIAGLVLSFAMTAGAQNPTDPPKPKVAVVKPKTDPKPPDSPSTAKPTPTPTSTGTPVKAGESPGFISNEEPTRLINEYLSKAWKENSITPAERCTDHEF